MYHFPAADLSLPALLRPLNRLLVPLIRTGFGSPPPAGAGLAVLEVVGRRSGQLRSVPLTCLALGDSMLIGTVRAKSQWVENLAAAGCGHIWRCGRRYAVQALVIDSGQLRTAARPDTQAPAGLDALLALSRAGALSLALLTKVADSSSGSFGAAAVAT